MTTKAQSTTETLEPCPLSHYVHAGLRAHKTGLDPRIVCLDCGLTLRAPDWIKVYERWQSRPLISPASAAPVVDKGPCIKCGHFSTIDIHNEGQCQVRGQSGFICGCECVFPAAAAATAAPEDRFCGFCRKSDQEVKVLIAASVGYICDECVAICAGIIERNLSAAPVEQSDDRWVTFGRVKVDLENETETFERINPPVAEPRYDERTCKHCGKSIKNSPRRPNRWTHIDTASLFCESASAPSTSARSAAEEIREWIGISGLVDGKGIDEVAAIVRRHFDSKTRE